MNPLTHDRLLQSGFTDQDIDRGWRCHRAQGTTRKEWNRYLNNLAEKLSGVV